MVGIPKWSLAPTSPVLSSSLVTGHEPRRGYCTGIVRGWAPGPMGLGPKPHDTLYDPVPILDL